MGVSSVSIERRKQAFMMWLLALLLCVAMPFSAFSRIAMESCYAFHELDYGGKRTTAGKVEFASYLFDASDDCKNQLAREDILKRDREGCDDLPTAIKTIKGAVGIEEPQKVVTIVNSVCLDALKELSYEEIIKLIKVIAKQPKLKEDSELAIIRLINAINSNKYGDFFQVLEENQNELIKYLVDQIDDASLCFWYGNNYTNFIGALVKMIKTNPAIWINRWTTNEDKLLERILIVDEYVEGDTDFQFRIQENKYRFAGRYDKETGCINIRRERKTRPSGGQSAPIASWTDAGTVVEGLSPLTPIIISTKKNLPLVSTALDAGNSSDGIYVIPAIFFKYIQDKEFDDEIERHGQIALDAITVASGGGAIVKGITTARRIYALCEVAGAIGNTMANLDPPTDPHLKAAVDAYNIALGGIGLKNTGKGIIEFANNLPDVAKTAIKENKSLRDALTTYSLDWQIISKEIDNFNNNDLNFVIQTSKLERSINVKNVFTYTPRTYELVEQLYKARNFKTVVGVEAILRQFDPAMLKKLSQCEGFDNVLYDMTKYWTKFRGEFQLNYAAKLINQGKKISFEVNDMSNNLQRIYDIVIKERSLYRTLDISLELKNWSAIYPDVIKKQFLKDLVKMEKLGDIQWIFKRTKTNPFTLERLRAEFIAALKQKGVKMEMEKLFDNKSFSDRMIEIFESNITNADELIEAIEDKSNFNQLFKITE